MLKKLVFIMISFGLLCIKLNAQNESQNMHNVIFLSDSPELFIWEIDPGGPPALDSVCYLITDTVFCSEVLVYQDHSMSYLRLSIIVKQDTSIWTDFWKSGNIKRIRKYKKTGNCLKGQLVEEAVFCENSNLILKRTKISKEEVERIVAFYCNGQRWLDLSYVDAKMMKVGKALEWWENGNLKCAANYSDSGKPIGKFIYYNERGRILRIEYYDEKSGELIKKRNFWWRK